MCKCSGARQGNGCSGCHGAPHSSPPIFIQGAPHSYPIRGQWRNAGQWLQWMPWCPSLLSPYVYRVYTMYKCSGAVQGDGGIGCDGSPHSYLPIFIQVAPHSSPNVSIQLTSAVAQCRAMVALDGLVPLTLISYPPIMCNLSCACHGAHHCSPTAVVNYQIVLANYLPPHFVVDISPPWHTTVTVHGQH